MPIRILLALITVLLSSSLAAAEMYKWVDKNGVVTFKDTPPPRKQKKVKVYSDSDFDVASQGESVGRGSSGSASGRKTTAHSEAQKPRANVSVEIYVTSWCPHCKEALSYMNSKGITYVSYDIETDAAAKRRYSILGGNGVPLIMVGSQKMVGFSADMLESYLKGSN